MVKNITVGISDELSKRMDELKDVNWSAVTRECIEQYIKQRTAGYLDQIIGKVKQKRGEEFKKGYEFIIKNINLLGLSELTEIAYPDEEKHPERLYEFFRRNPASRMLGQKLLSYEEDEKGMYIFFIVSDDFQKGLKEAAEEILNKSR